ncbi:hypothetical protein IWQ60_005049 [Tieghemiomyces parasiticus]|uniref:Uncharacterized protein n=1 Tax=Tieghemiomyces parasiticus TaxID=78921 RepID=A0A9W8AF89_9FUNG|nr:hypothetical protein IWQ60_005049 [Tieghemiomyces parasiticus]
MGKAAAEGITLNDSADVPTLAQNESPSRTGDTVPSISSLVENFRTDLHAIADGSSLVNLDHPTWKSLLTRTGPLFYALQTSQTDYLFLFTRYIASRAFKVAFLADTDSWIPDRHWELAEILEDPMVAYTVHNIRNSDKKPPIDLSNDPDTLYNYDHRLKSKQRFMDNLLSSLVQSVVVSFAARNDAQALVSYTSLIARLPAVKNRPPLQRINLEVLAMAVSLQTSQFAIMHLLAKRTLSSPLAIEVASKFQESPAEAAELYRKTMDASELQGRRVSLPGKNVLPIMIQADGTLAAKVYSPVEQL